jgi:hypothetical protein
VIPPELFGVAFVLLVAILVLTGVAVIMLGQLLKAIAGAKRLRRPRTRTTIFASRENRG